ncbi:MAG TPA: hypothetical protein VFG73_05745 [Rhodanobacteraceae bacterium]|nr:hypothetical protein [Rhodanobacteraceae bacterium]
MAELMAGCGRLVVVASRPADETLGAGGAIAMWRARGGPLVVVMVSDGGTHPAAPPAGESVLALRHLGWSQPSIMRWHLPPGAIASHEQRLVARLRLLLRPDDRVLARWSDDGDADAAAVAQGVRRAAAHVGCAVAQFPLWRRPAALAAAGCAREVMLDTPSFWRKRKALTAYRSQLDPCPETGAPPLPEHVLAPCLLARELLVEP